MIEEDADVGVDLDSVTLELKLDVVVSAYTLEVAVLKALMQGGYVGHRSCSDEHCELHDGLNTVLVARDCGG